MLKCAFSSPFDLTHKAHILDIQVRKIIIIFRLSSFELFGLKYFYDSLFLSGFISVSDEEG
jgi:hypothetical protein